LCSIGNGRVQEDCFTVAHETEEKLDLVCKKHVEMKKRVRNSKRNSEPVTYTEFN
jgi:hypothetical protein